MQIKDATFVIVDLETTGTRMSHDRILEIGAVKVRSDTVEDTFNTLVDPMRRISRRITRLTGITPADVFGEPEVLEVLPDFVEFIGDAVFVAHNCVFDWKFIDAELSRAGLPALKNQRLCTARLARRLLSGLPSRSLESLISFFELRPDSRHRALSDALATQQVFARLLNRLEKQHGITELEELLRYQNTRYVKRGGNQHKHDYIRQNRFKELPSSAGVYRMIGKGGKLLYVGKARVLSERVRSYFAGTEGHATHIRKMVRQIHEIDWTQTETELEALLLESRLIKEHVPPFNKAGRTYRQQPFLRLGKIANSNWVTLIEHIRADGARHYGPMASRQEAVFVARALVSLYGVASDSFRSLGRTGMGLEAARIGAPLTDEGFLHAIDFLEGKNSDALATLERSIYAASEAQEYEVAAQRRDSLAIMRTIHARPYFLRTPLLERRGAVLYPWKNKIEVHFMAYGAPVAHIVWPCDQQILDAAKTEFHNQMCRPPDRLSMQQVDAIRLFGSWMFRERENVSVLVPSAEEASSTFDATLESLLHELCPDQKKR